MSQPKFEVKTTQLTSRPFINMKNIESHTSCVLDCTSAIFPDGKTKIITCSIDYTLQIFDLGTLKCEKIINHSSSLLSVHFYKEEQILLTTDWNGELVLWDIFSPEIKIIKTIEVSKPDSYLWKLTQVSSNLFFCGVLKGSSDGSLYSLKFIKNQKVRINEIHYSKIYYQKEGLECIYKLINEKNTIIFSGGGFRSDITIKLYNFEKQKNIKFQEKHYHPIQCLTSFINNENEENIISGSRGRRIIFWRTNGEYFKIMELNGVVDCFLNDFRRKKKNIFIITGFYDYSIYSLNLETKKIIKIVKRIHDDTIQSVKWINSNEENFISCSKDKSFNIFELEKLPTFYENSDLKERLRFIRDEEFLEKYFNKKMLFSVKIFNNLRIGNILKIFLVY